jgi:hypothetical protein
MMAQILCQGLLLKFLRTLFTGHGFGTVNFKQAA